MIGEFKHTFTIKHGPIVTEVTTVLSGKYFELDKEIIIKYYEV